MKLPNRLDPQKSTTPGIPLLFTHNVKREIEAIQLQRAQFNEAIAAHDTRNVGACWLPDVQVSTSSGKPLVGRDAVQRAFEHFFADRDFITFVRTPAQIVISEDGRTAAESGEWTGYWRTKTDKHVQRGAYLGSWSKRGERWLLQAELFVPLSEALESVSTP